MLSLGREDFLATRFEFNHVLPVRICYVDSLDKTTELYDIWSRWVGSFSHPAGIKLDRYLTFGTALFSLTFGGITTV